MVARSGAWYRIGLLFWKRKVNVLSSALREVTAKLTTTFVHVLDFRAVAAWAVVGRLIRVCLKLSVSNWHAHCIAECLEVIQGHLLHLVGSVATLEALAKAIPLDCLRDDYGGLTLVA